jgi:hypothetical protein
MAKKKAKARVRKGSFTIQLTGEFTAALAFLLADERKKTGAKVAKAAMLRRLVWEAAQARGWKP